MMPFIRRTLVLFLVLVLSPQALAAPPARAAAPQPSAPPAQPPEPGTCSTIQPQVKQCAVSAIGGVGTFGVIVAPPTGLVVAFDDAVTGMQPPPSSSYRASFSGTTATVVPIVRTPIPGATVHFDTATVHVTLKLKLGSPPDTQLLIVDPRKGLRDEEVERRVKEAVDGLEDRANQRADELLVSDIASSGVDLVDADVAPSRHNQVVLRAQKIARIGNRRVLLLSIMNRSADELEVKSVRAWLGPAGAERELPRPTYRLRAKTVPVNEEMAVAVSLPKPLASSDRLRLRIELTDPERSVELAGIRVR